MLESRRTILRGICPRKGIETDRNGKPQRLRIYAIWIDVHGDGLPADSTIKPDRIIRSLTELLP